MRGEGMARLLDIAAGGAGGRAPDFRGLELFGDEVDDALLGLEGPGDAQERGRVARRVSRNRFKTLA